MRISCAARSITKVLWRGRDLAQVARRLARDARLRCALLARQQREPAAEGGPPEDVLVHAGAGPCSGRRAGAARRARAPARPGAPRTRRGPTVDSRAGAAGRSRQRARSSESGAGSPATMRQRSRSRRSDHVLAQPAGIARVAELAAGPRSARRARRRACAAARPRAAARARRRRRRRAAPPARAARSRRRRRDGGIVDALPVGRARPRAAGARPTPRAAAAPAGSRRRTGRPRAPRRRHRSWATAARREAARGDALAMARESTTARARTRATDSARSAPGSPARAAVIARTPSGSAASSRSEARRVDWGRRRAAATPGARTPSQKNSPGTRCW